eukprot:1158748-Pelagomonas_calceolata.AAC.22
MQASPFTRLPQAVHLERQESGEELLARCWRDRCALPACFRLCNKVKREECLCCLPQGMMAFQDSMALEGEKEKGGAVTLQDKRNQILFNSVKNIDGLRGMGSFSKYQNDLQGFFEVPAEAAWSPCSARELSTSEVHTPPQLVGGSMDKTESDCWDHKVSCEVYTEVTCQTAHQISVCTRAHTHTHTHTHLRDGVPDGLRKAAALSQANRTSSPLGHTAMAGASAEPTEPTFTATTAAAAACTQHANREVTAEQHDEQKDGWMTHANGRCRQASH